MARQAVSVTLETRNLTWLRGRAVASGESLSELLDQLVTSARRHGGIGAVLSVVGTIDIDSGDPLLEHADADVSRMFERSIGRPLVVRERSPSYGRATRARKRRG